MITLNHSLQPKNPSFSSATSFHDIYLSIKGIYIALLQDNYSEALLIQALSQSSLK